MTRARKFMCFNGHLISERQYEAQRCTRCTQNAIRAARRLKARREQVEMHPAHIEAMEREEQ